MIIKYTKYPIAESVKRNLSIIGISERWPPVVPALWGWDRPATPALSLQLAHLNVTSPTCNSVARFITASG